MQPLFLCRQWHADDAKKRISTDQIRQNPFFPRHLHAILMKLKMRDIIGQLFKENNCNPAFLAGIHAAKTAMNRIVAVTSR